MKPHLAVYGHIILDTIIDSPREPGNEEFVGIKDFHVRYGGTGANVAMGAAKLKIPVSLYAFVGNDFPEEYWSELENSGMDLSGVIMVKGKSPRVWVVNTPEGQRGYVFQGVMEHMESYEPMFPRPNVKWVHFSTGRPAYYLPIAERMKKKGKKIGFDPGQEIHYFYDAESLRAMLSHADIFFCNESELDKAMSILGIRDISGILDIVPMIVNTLGSEGSRIITRKGEQRIPVIHANLVDPTGAGDAYRAGFYTGLFRGLDYFEAGLLGSAVASIVIEAHGAQEPLPTMEEVRKRLKSAGYEVKI